MSYTPPAYTDAGGTILTGYTPPAYTDVGGDVFIVEVVPSTPFIRGKIKLHSYLPTSTTVTATSTTLVESGIALSLAANTTYYINSVTYNNSNGDGIKLKYYYTGTIVDGTLFSVGYLNSSAEPLSVTGGVLVNTSVDGIIKVEGIIRTGSVGILSLQFAKATDVGSDTPLQPGSFLAATPLYI